MTTGRPGPFGPGSPAGPEGPALQLDPGPPFDPSGQTYLEAIMFGIRDALAADPRVFVYGEDVDGKYGNAFLLLRPLLGEFGGRIINSPLAEGAVLGVCVGAATNRARGPDEPRSVSVSPATV